MYKIISTIIVFIICCAIKFSDNTNSIFYYFDGQTAGQAMISELIKESSNDNLPMKIDNSLTFEKITIDKPNVINYIYTLTDATLIEKIKTDPAIRVFYEQKAIDSFMYSELAGSFYQLKLSIQVKYYDSSNELIFTIPISYEQLVPK